MGSCDGPMPEPDRWKGKKKKLNLVQISKCRSKSVSKALGSLEVYFHVEKKEKKRKAINRTKGPVLHCTVVYFLPGMNTKKAGTALWGVCVGVCTHLRACVTESPEQLK